MEARHHATDRQTQRPRILLVDDELSIRQLLSIVLEVDGYDVRSVGNGREGLEFLDTGELPDLILLDLMMPVMNGWIFFETLRADRRFDSIPVIILTAYSKSEIHIPDVETLRKPINFATLRRILRKHLRGKST